jgi:hypothetical protein
MTNNTIAYFETSDRAANLDDLARDVCAKDEWIFDPGKHEVAHILFQPIGWVDGHCAILDDNLMLARGSVRCRLDLKNERRTL